MLPEDYNNLNPTELLDFCRYVVQFVPLDCGSVVVVYHGDYFCFITEFSEKKTLQIVWLTLHVLHQGGNRSVFRTQSESTIGFFAKTVNDFN